MECLWCMGWEGNIQERLSGSLLLFFLLQCVVHGCDVLYKRGFATPYVLLEHMHLSTKTSPHPPTQMFYMKPWLQYSKQMCSSEGNLSLTPKRIDRHMCQLIGSFPGLFPLITCTGVRDLLKLDNIIANQASPPPPPPMPYETLAAA